MKKKIIISLIAIVLSLTPLIFNIYASGSGSGAVDLDESFNIDPKVSLQEIKIPYFPQFVLNSKYNTIFSWLSFIGVIITVGIIIYWIFFILRAGVKAMRSEDSAKALQDSWQEISAVFSSMALSLGFPLILNLLGVAFGVGFMWDWPLAFRSCPKSSEYEYFYQAFASAKERGIDSVAAAEAICY